MAVDYRDWMIWLLVTPFLPGLLTDDDEERQGVMVDAMEAVKVPWSDIAAAIYRTETEYVKGEIN